MSVTVDRAERRRPSRRVPQGVPGESGLPGRKPRRVHLDIFLAAVGVGLGATVGSGLVTQQWSQLGSVAGLTMLLGNMTGLVGTYFALVMVLLVSRIPQVERVLGQDGLLRWHRRLSPWPISLIVAHAVLLTYAYSRTTRTGVLAQLGSFWSSYSGMLVAILGFAVFLVVAVASVYSVRRRLRRETWWAIHLGMYLAFALAFVHQITLGPSFVDHPLAEAIWCAAWAATAGLVLAYRFGLPLVRTAYYGLRVHEVRQEADGVVSVICRGRHLEHFRVAGGQFLEWRFLAPRLWWHAHPYSLSSRPRPPYLRLTARAVGDHSAALARLKPGTRVALEGPYGAFTAHGRVHRRTAFVVGGIGVTAARSLLEDLTPGSDPVVLWRVSSPGDTALRQEVEEYLARLGGRLTIAAGSRSEVGMDELLTAVPDLGERDVYVSGPEGFVLSAVEALGRLGVASDSVHYEVYAL